MSFRMRILGVDVGDKRIGLALSDPHGIVGKVLTTIEYGYREEEKLFSRLLSLSEENEVGEIVVGFPLNLDGTLGRQGKKVLAFIEKLKQRVGFPIKKWDERFSTKIATDLLLQANLSRKRRKKLVDGISAVVILQSYLDSRNTQ